MSTANLMDFENGFKAVINYDPEIEMLRGEFVGLSGGADFYASNIEDLKTEGIISLRVFIQACEEENIRVKKSYSGRFNLRIRPLLHEKIAELASSQGVSINKVVEDALDLVSEG
ncbi:MAG: type II toxin-antitoxin system HicB family antitoxin [Gammaproteobacteria bacterium]|nr:type II toxin-antitoxin system HicB family antitoxin [Gammaproteobacteria bacterium]